VVHVPVDPHLINAAIAASDLPEAREARSNGLIGSKLAGIVSDVDRVVGGGVDDGAGANQAHVADKNVPQLGQFVETRRTEQSANGGNAWIILELMGVLPLGPENWITGEILFEQLLGVLPHRAE